MLTLNSTSIKPQQVDEFLETKNTLVPDEKTRTPIFFYRVRATSSASYPDIYTVCDPHPGWGGPTPPLHNALETTTSRSKKQRMKS